MNIFSGRGCFLSNESQTRDKQNQEVNSSEQYAINVIDNKALQSADYVVKESKRALEKAIGKRTMVPVLFLLVTVLLFRFVLFIGYVPTESMEPTLPRGSIIVGSRIFDDLKLRDIIVFRHDGKLMVKRIAAVFGDEVIHKGIMIQVPRGSFYVLGDNKGD